jgi:hypothetical protein
MSKNAKLDVYKVLLTPSSEKRKKTYSFREFFIAKYSLKETATDNQIFNAFFQDIFKSSEYKDDEKKRKAFRLSKNITKKNNSFVIHGVVEGGPYDSGKTTGNRKTKRDSKKISKNVIIQDDFYFLLQTKLDEKHGILILQTYSQDRIDDVFKPFITKLFKHTGQTFNGIISQFVPESIKELAKQTAFVKELNYQTNNLKINQLSDDKKDILAGKFNLKITLTALDNSIPLPTLNKWKKMLGHSLLKLPQNEMTLENFNSKTGYIKSDTIKNPARFEIDEERIEINPTIFLEKVDEVVIEENGVPQWESLEKYCLNTLLPDLELEVYGKD